MIQVRGSTQMTLAELKAIADEMAPIYKHPSTRITITTNSPDASRLADFFLAANPKTVKQLIERIEGLSAALKKIAAFDNGTRASQHLSHDANLALSQFGADVKRQK